jgi:hypothetical protein
MSKNNLYKEFVINLIASTYAYIINISLYHLNKSEKKYYYNNWLGFGDSFIFYLKNYYKICKKNNYALSFGLPTYKSINFFFSPKNIKKIFPTIPEKVYYRVVNKLAKYKNFKPKNFGTFSSQYQFNNSEYYRNLIILLLKKFKFKKELLNFANNKYLCLFIKHYNTNSNDLSGSSTRQTANLTEIQKIFSFLKKKKIMTVVLGTDADKSINIFKTFVKRKKLHKYVLFAKDITPNYCLKDQLFLAHNSIGYIGSTSGPASLFYFLRKKMLILNCLKEPMISHCHDKKNEKKFIRYLYKYILSNKKKYIQVNNPMNCKSTIYEASFQEIKNKIVNFILK